MNVQVLCPPRYLMGGFCFHGWNCQATIHYLLACLNPSVSNNPGHTGVLIFKISGPKCKNLHNKNEEDHLDQLKFISNVSYVCMISFKHLSWFFFLKNSYCTPLHHFFYVVRFTNAAQYSVWILTQGRLE